MKTAEITRDKSLHRSLIPGEPAATAPPSTWKLFMDTYRKEGLRGINKGVNAVAIRQMTKCVLVFPRRFRRLPAVDVI
jgi:hypothetical protein